MGKGVRKKMKKLTCIFPATLVVIPLTLVLWGLVANSAHAAEQPSAGPLEEVVALVGDEIILKSEIDEQVALYLMQAQIDPSDTTKVKDIRKEILDRMIDAKVIINEARKRQIVVTKQELDTAINDALQDVKTRMGSEEKFRQELKS